MIKVLAPLLCQVFGVKNLARNPPCKYKAHFDSFIFCIIYYLNNSNRAVYNIILSSITNTSGSRGGSVKTFIIDLLLGLGLSGALVLTWR